MSKAEDLAAELDRIATNITGGGDWAETRKKVEKAAALIRDQEKRIEGLKESKASIKRLYGQKLDYQKSIQADNEALLKVLEAAEEVKGYWQHSVRGAPSYYPDIYRTITTYKKGKKE